MTYNDINAILQNFAKSNMVFSNEYDFQFELAQALQKLSFVKDVKMEVLSLEKDWAEVKLLAKQKQKLSAKTKEYTDIMVETNDGKFYAFELKYKTPDRICVYENTRFGDVVTMVQGAHDINAYAFWHDVERLEKINQRNFSKNIKIEKSFAIFLTNHATYRYNDFSGSSIWKKYSMQEGKVLTTGLLTFRETNEPFYKTSGQSFDAINLTKTYKNLRWENYELGNSDYNDYPNEHKTEHSGFSYLILEVHPI